MSDKIDGLEQLCPLCCAPCVPIERVKIGKGVNGLVPVPQRFKFCTGCQTEYAGREELDFNATQAHLLLNQFCDLDAPEFKGRHDGPALGCRNGPSESQMTLEEFIVSGARSAWIAEPFITVYVRKANRFIESEPVTCIDVANIEVQEEMRGQGVFRKWLKKAESLGFNIYVENVLEEKLVPFLLRSGYIERAGFPTSYYKIFKT